METDRQTDRQTDGQMTEREREDGREKLFNQLLVSRQNIKRCLWKLKTLTTLCLLKVRFTSGTKSASGTDFHEVSIVGTRLRVPGRSR